MSYPSPELYRDLVEFAPDALILVESTGLIVYANTHAHTLFGHEPGQLSGVCVDELIPGESRGPHAAHRSAYAQRPRLREMGNRGMPLFGLRRDGTRFRAEIRLAPVHTAQGNVSAAIVRDATESEHFLAMLASARKVAEEANEAKSRLLAAASHDLRQPMQTLRLLNAAMKRLTQDSNMREVLEQEERALNTMSDLLHALLNIAKLESGTLQANLARVRLPAIFEDLRNQFAPLAKFKGVDLLIVTSEVQMCTDTVLMTEVLQNLLANALRYTDNGQVTLRCIPGRVGFALIEVEDSGIGITEAARARIFDDFFQAAPRGSTHRGGAGLGLGIVRRLTQLLNIPVRVASTVGVGTCFTLEIAVLERSGAALQDRAAGGAAAQSKGLEIILVEDNCSMRDALRTYLRFDDHTVHTAASLSELEDVLDSLVDPPAIVISDFHLGPTERGSDAIDRIRQRFARTIPAILLTGDTSAVPAQVSSLSGLRLLNKPVDTTRLVAMIDELLRSA